MLNPQSFMSLMSFTLGTKYVGTWKEGKREGHGELIHANHKYVGVYKDDKVETQHSPGLPLAPYRCLTSSAFIFNLEKGEARV